MPIETTIEVPATSRLTRLPPVGTVPPVLVIEPASGWQPINVRELWHFRELIYFLAWRDVKVRYRQTLLGAAWAIVQPLSMMVIFSVFFGRVAAVGHAGVAYPLFVFAGLLAWTLFAATVTSAGNSVVGSERLITKIYFPRLAVPFASVGSALIDFVIAFGMLVLLLLWYGVWPSWELALVPLAVILILVAGIGVGTLLAALNVAFRDFKHVIPFLVQLWMFATPTIYLQPDSTTFAGWRWVLLGNPLIGLVSTFRALTLGLAIDWLQLAVSAATVAVSTSAGSKTVSPT
jgi:lipopolysaccharide transport system permease protein